MPARNVNLTRPLEAFIEASVSSGRYQNASEVVRDALRLLEQRQQEDRLKLEALRAAIAVGLEDARTGRVSRVPAGDVRRYLSGLGKTGAAGA
jgi:antitoxin ParD1/3/4